ncbi:hypothetical protein F7725_003704 [Dissostichus mawsoni]|uniref:Secreted protein n=1 Tax=Dissostichus mawsoni TaxID=36200 RepID=A0A7J5YAY0_DISMA|nr:hypothetical protein F7725_003704 [Dissostichus mawsoni]
MNTADCLSYNHMLLLLTTALCARHQGVHVALGLLQAVEDLFEQRLVLGGVLAEAFVHLLHLPADPLQGLRGRGGLRRRGHGGDSP